MNTRMIAVAIVAILALAASAATSAIDAFWLRIGFQLAIVGAAVSGAARGMLMSGGDATGGAIAESPQGAANLGVMVKDRRRPIVDRETGLCVDWYFRLRLEEEIARAARFGQRFSVVQIAQTGDRTRHALTLARLLRSVDYAADLGDTLAVVLPNTAEDGAIAFQERLGDRLDDAEVTMLEYPRDGQTVGQLIGVSELKSFRGEIAAA